MAYLIFTVNQREIGRCKLDGKVVVGRAPECNVCVHDILLSRTHCQFEPNGSGWAIVDLSSKNGTFMGGRTISRQALRDGDSVTIGKTKITYSALKPAPVKVRGGAALAVPNKSRTRPADPWAAMEGTMSGFDYIKAKAEEKAERIGAKARMEEIAPMFSKGARLPTPQPFPREPRSYESEDIYGMLSGLVSSSWDSIYMTASRPPRPIPPRPIIVGLPPRHPRHSPADLALQVTQGLLAPAPGSRPSRSTRASRWKRALRGVARGLVTIGRAVMVLGVVHLLRHG